MIVTTHRRLPDGSYALRITPPDGTDPAALQAASLEVDADGCVCFTWAPYDPTLYEDGPALTRSDYETQQVQEAQALIQAAIDRHTTQADDGEPLATEGTDLTGE